MKLKEWREKKGISQADFAKSLLEFTGKYVSQRTVCSWENNALPRKFWIKAIVEITKQKVTVADLAQ